MVDHSVAGRALTPVTAQVEPGRLRFFRETTGERNPVYSDAGAARAAGYAAMPVPPTYLFCLEMMDAEQAFEFLDILGADLSQVLHGEQSFTYRAPVMVGDTLRFEPRIGTVTDKKGGAMTLAVVETRVTNQHGVHVADCSRTVVVLNKVTA
jgi:acyl dehydratase